jgi:NAD(P)-dependent dehydrogenase (short-subunit alcohol dehydrogenase family)
MTDQDYTTSFTVDSDALAVYEAINDVRGWWSQDVEGSTDAVGAEFVFRAEDIHYSRIRVAELVPGERVRWEVLDNELGFTTQQGEWPGTTITFELSPHGSGTTVRFSHRGLVPAHECYDVCSNAWGFYIHSSLRERIATGNGEPIERVQRHPADRIDGAVALVTGANRGIGRALTEALLNRGAARVYATAREPESLTDLVARYGARVQTLRLDVTDAAQVAEVARLARDVDLLVNNAGVAEAWELLGDGVLEHARHEIDVNYLGPMRLLQAFAGTLTRREGAIVNVGSAAGLVNVPLLPTYSASKAALHSLTQATRAILAGRGVAVFGVYAGPVDTDMTRSMPLEKTSAADVAAAILDGIAAGEEDIFPDPFAIAFGAQFGSSPKDAERQFAAMVG